MTIAPPAPSTKWAYFLDIDGTLIDIARTPDDVIVDEELPRLIDSLHSLCGGAVALVSGRALADIDRLLGMPHLPMAGLHGLEWRTGGGNAPRCCDASPPELEVIKRRLSSLRQRHEQLIVEDKGPTLALHYRQAPRLGGYLHRWVHNLVNLSGKNLQVQPGKRVIEIKPRGIDKGSVVTAFMAQNPFAGRMPVFIGDDLTDENGFVVINQMGGLSIKVGRGHTAATCRLPNVAAVHHWLSRLTVRGESENTGAANAIT